MTDYRYWEKFDEESVLNEIERSDLIKSNNLKKEQILIKKEEENEEKIINALKKTEIIESKSAVDALKAKGRRIRKKNAEPSKLNQKIEPKFQNENKNTILINQISECLMKILRYVEDLRKISLNKNKHREGFQLAIQCLKDLKNYSKIKESLLTICIDKNSYNSVVNDLKESEKFLFNQCKLYLCLFSLSIGMFSMTVELSRQLLKEIQDENLNSGVDQETKKDDVYEAGIWCLRGLAFAGMGNIYLSNLHLKSALSACPSYPGLSNELITEIQFEYEEKFAKNLFQMSFKESLYEEIMKFFGLHFKSYDQYLLESPDLSTFDISIFSQFIYEDKRQILSFNTSLTENENSNKSIFSHDTDLLMEDVIENQVQGNEPLEASEWNTMGFVTKILSLVEENILTSHTKSHFNDIISSFLEFINFHFDKSSKKYIVTSFALLSLDFIRQESFMQAQIFYTESCFYSAQIRYSVSIVVSDMMDILLVQYKTLYEQIIHTSQMIENQGEELDPKVLDSAKKFHLNFLPILESRQLQRINDKAIAYLNSAFCIAQRKPRWSLKMGTPKIKNTISEPNGCLIDNNTQLLDDRYFNPMEWFDAGVELVLGNSLTESINDLTYSHKYHPKTIVLLGFKKLALLENQENNIQSQRLFLDLERYWNGYIEAKSQEKLCAGNYFFLLDIDFQPNLIDLFQNERIFIGSDSIYKSEDQIEDITIESQIKMYKAKFRLKL